MQMWMLWMIWIAFLMVIFGMLADALSVCKGYAKSWIMAGLFLGPIALIILIVRPDPKGQVSYINQETKPPETWTCPVCGTENPASHSWCGDCGNSRD